MRIRPYDFFTLPRVVALVASVMLIAGVGARSYVFYQLLRWVVSLAACWRAYIASKHKSRYWVLGFLIVAIIFNPIAPIRFGKDVWMIVDVSVAIFFTISIFAPHISKEI